MDVGASRWFPYWDRREDLRESIGHSGPCVMRFGMKIRKDLYGGWFDEGGSRQGEDSRERGQPIVLTMPARP